MTVGGGRWEWTAAWQDLRLLAGLFVDRAAGRPMMLSHLVTCRCPCRCETCLWRDLTDARDELTAAEIDGVYRDAVQCGMRINAVWGGEPLVRDDLPQILRASRQAGLMTVLITSGYRIHERLHEIVPALDTIIFSLDDLGRRHDALRGWLGLFDEVCDAIARVRATWPDKRVYVNTVVSRLNADGVIAMARLARDLGVSIYFNPMETGMLGQPGSASAKAALALDEASLSELARRLILLKGRGYPIANSNTYLRGFVGGKQPYQCHARKVCLELRPNGDVMDCLDRFRPVANVRQVRLAKLLGRPEIRQQRLRPVACHVCNNANVIDTSNVWALRPESIYSLLRRRWPARRREPTRTTCTGP